MVVLAEVEVAQQEVVSLGLVRMEAVHYMEPPLEAVVVGIMVAAMVEQEVPGVHILQEVVALLVQVVILLAQAVQAQAVNLDVGMVVVVVGMILLMQIQAVQEE
jgi:hypothetical protein